MKSIFKFENLLVEPNYGDHFSYEDKNKDCIHINRQSSEKYVGITLKEAKFIIQSLNEIINYYDDIPNINDSVRITNGIFKGYQGIIKDIDNCDSKRPLVISLDDNADFNNCVCFVGFDDVKIIR